MVDKINVVLLVAAVTIIVGSLFFFSNNYLGAVTSLPVEDFDELTGEDNLIVDPYLDSFCEITSTGASYTSSALVDGVSRSCDFTYREFDDGVAYGVGSFAQPYNYDLNYGCCLHRYEGPEEPLIGNEMLLLNKQTHRDWYGFGWKNVIPASSGNVYGAWIYAKRLEKANDDRDCLFRIRFENTAGQTLTYTQGEDSDLGVGNGDWGKVEAIALAPVGTAFAGFEIWCSQNGDYQYLIDGQYLGLSEFCTPGMSRECGNFDIGECSFGTQTCEPEGVWGDCIGDVNPVAEIMDGKDNDCDGEVDEQIGGEPEPEESNMGVIIGIVAVLLVGGFYIMKRR